MAGAGSAWSNRRSCSRSSAAPHIPVPTGRPCWPPRPSRRPEPTLKRIAGSPRSQPATHARPWRSSTRTSTGIPWRCRRAPRRRPGAGRSPGQSASSPGPTSPTCCRFPRAGREGGGRRARRLGREGVRRGRRAQGVWRGDPGARGYRLHVGVRPAHLHEAREGARADVRRRRLPPRADRPARREVAGDSREPVPAPPPPLDGVRVVDLTSYIAGSYAAMQLADLGAAVIKVEALEGDSFRELPGFFGWNRGKRSLAVNLKTPEGREIVHKLAERSDVVMENMRPGVAERLGVGYERLRAINPRLIYSSVTAFGSTGPDADRPGFDPIFQALGGLMTLQGFGGAPQYQRTAPTDYYTAALATQGILAELFTRERTGRGQRVETSLLRGVLALQAGGALSYPGRPRPS